MTATNHKPGKRRNLLRWMQARQRRLWFEVNRGTATARQADRCNQLTPQIAKLGGDV